MKYEVFLFNVKEDTRSETLGEYETKEDARKEVKKLRKDGLPAFWRKKNKHKNDKNKVFNVPVTWQMCGIYRIEAKTLKEAKRKIFGADCPLPDGSYLDDSLAVDEESIKLMRQFKKSVICEG